MNVKLGSVAHFSLPVREPVASAKWWMTNFDLAEVRASADRVLLRNDNFMLVLFRGEPRRDAGEHMAFNVADVDALTEAGIALLAKGVELEDGENAIGPVVPGSSSLGLWFRDPDGYRWELYVR